MIGENPPVENLTKEKETEGTDPDPQEEISAGAIRNQDSEAEVPTQSSIKEIQEETRGEIGKDPRQPETILHHLLQEDLILHFLPDGIHHRSRDSQDHKITAETGEGPFLATVVQQAEIVLSPAETETEEETPDQDTTHLLTTKERTVLSTIK